MNAVEQKYQFAPWPYFGGKRSIASEVWSRLGRPTQYIEPFCGSAAVLLAAPSIASLEVVNDMNFYIANFWRALKCQPDACYQWQDYPVSHVDLAARHIWLTDPERCQSLCEKLMDADWPGDPKFAGWWAWGQSCWIGSGWCEKVQERPSAMPEGVCSQVPHVSDAGMGVQSQVPHVSNAGRGMQSKVPHVSDAGMGVLDWFQHLAHRLERVRIMHGDWSRCLNHHYGGKDTAIFFDPPYKSFERLYHKNGQVPVADAVAEWCAANEDVRIALCGHRGDYNLPGWSVLEWSRGRLTYGGGNTTDEEAIWFSPTCIEPQPLLL